MENLAAVFYGANDLRLTFAPESGCIRSITVRVELKSGVLATQSRSKLYLVQEDHPVEEPKSGEVQIRVHKCGVCMTDATVVTTGSVGKTMCTSEPFVMGHEYSGVVTKVGSDVTNLNPGDRVALDNLVSCGHCRLCKTGHSNVCYTHCFIGFPPYGRGGMARKTTVPATCLHRLPDCMDFEEAALMEPLSVCVNAVGKADVNIGDDIMVFGAGPIGLLTLQVARAEGAHRVCVADICEDRLELAQKLGATHTVLFDKGETDAQVNAQKIKHALGGDCADAAIECSGAPVCLQTSIHVVRPAGVVVLVGFGPDDVMIPAVRTALNEIDVKGCVCNNHGLPTSIKLVASGKVKVKPIISHRFRLEEVHMALELVRQRKVVKVMIDCSGEQIRSGLPY